MLTVNKVKNSLFRFCNSGRLEKPQDSCDKKFCNLMWDSFTEAEIKNTDLLMMDAKIAKLIQDNAQDKVVLHGAVRFVNHAHKLCDSGNLDFPLKKSTKALLNCGIKKKAKSEP